MPAPRWAKTLNCDVDNFNSFIDNSSLIDLPLGGHLFTWMNKAGTKLSKLDRFLISEEVVEALHDVRVIAIDLLWSDHNPILLHVSKSDFGPTPFKLFHSWLLRDSFDKLIKSIEEKIEASSANDDDLDSRIKLLQEVDILDTFESFDLFQKARVKWDIEEKFKNHDSNVDFPLFCNSSGLCALDHDSLETPVSLDEVKNAVWDCGSSKAPSPDGFFFAFVKKYWDDIRVYIMKYVNIFLDTGSLPHGSSSSFFTLIPKVNNPIFIKDFRPISLICVHYKIIAKILANRLAKVIDKIVSHEQSTFIAGRQIINGPLILSEIVEWFKKRRKVVNFQELVYPHPGLRFPSMAVLPQNFLSNVASEKEILSRLFFLFLLWRGFIMLSIVVSSGLIRGVKFGFPELTISHLFYADDVNITTEWNANDLDNIIHVLQVFYLASDLKFNIQKSNIYGIGVSDVDVSSMASNSGCASGSFPFTYLRLPIGSNMSLRSSWQVLLDKFQSKLSPWKANLLSI
ncbi:RNA-directed DNA polymerase, eukaryota, reverse transcriptase zinc-binding domain protein [Tanacetum coccineum]|uniref:RNA-directed DNA polymerase, eukaryota, reverse transcriptase zinc-binding domain protein n=1 Tax=Tanacetum coccineum TaxID=301880 RepID=A0ABQ4XZ94_9ASTR